MEKNPTQQFNKYELKRQQKLDAEVRTVKKAAQDAEYSYQKVR